MAPYKPSTVEFKPDGTATFYLGVGEERRLWFCNNVCFSMVSGRFILQLLFNGTKLELF